MRNSDDTLYIDLLKPAVEDTYRVDPEELARQVSGKKRYKWVVIDEVQKLPKLLDVVHNLIEENDQKFILSGSSARKLKRGAANLLAGRAFVYHLHPFTSVELGDSFDLDCALQWGLLPKVWNLQEQEDKHEFLRSYALTYLKEEIQAEQIVRILDPFRSFLEVAAQTNGKIVNFSKVARDVGVDTTTVQNYYSILEDTLVGFFLNSFHRSVRKRQHQAPKFYFFDPGVVRMLSRTLDLPLVPSTASYGELFEQFLILEIRKLAEYRRKEWEFSYLRTKDDVEIDLIIDRARRPLICVEIKSTRNIRPDDINQFMKITGDMTNIEAYCFSNDPRSKKIGHVHCLHWTEGLKELGLV
ncbi:MAG: ATP-binding protein [Bdellovibrionaceae bacterium]|nr:ATP-binding protein [Pseudobdellovibrionaceae bacterium]